MPSIIADGSGTAFKVAPPTPPPREIAGELVAPLALNRLPPEARNELAGETDPARSKLLDDEEDACVALAWAMGPGLSVAIAAAIGLPSASDGASVNVAPSPITSEVWLMWFAVRLAMLFRTTLPPTPPKGSIPPTC